MRFSYTAVNEKGVRTQGTEEASDAFELAAKLKEKGYTLLSAEDAADAERGVVARINAFLSTVRAQEKVIFAKNLAAMIRAGLPLARSLGILKRQTKNEKLKSVIGELIESVRSGETLSSAMEKFPKVFSRLFVSMVRSGEESGKLADALSVVGEQMEKSYLLKKKIKGALIYPGIILSAMFIVGILMLVYVVPTLTATFKELDVPLPASTRAIIAVSDFLRGNAVASLSAFVIFIFGVVSFFRTRRGKRIFDFSVLRIPVIGVLVKKTNAARTTRTLSSLLSSGVDIVAALRITADVLQNGYYKDVVASAEERIQKGTQLSRVFIEAEDLYPILVGEMIEVGEETGKLSEMLLEVASFYEKEVEDATKNMATIIEPFLMVVVGVAVGFFAVAMISPTYSLLNSI